MHAQHSHVGLRVGALLAATMCFAPSAWAHVPPTYPVDPPFSVQATADATVNTVDYLLGKYVAGTTIRVGTCVGNNDLVGATSTGPTYLRLGYWDESTRIRRWVTVAEDKGSCNGGSYIVYSLPRAMTLYVRAGCQGSASCSGTVKLRWDLDGNGALPDVPAAFKNLVLTYAPRGDTGHIAQAGKVPSDYTVGQFGAVHFEGVQRLRAVDAFGKTNYEHQRGGFMAVSGNSGVANLLIARVMGSTPGFESRWVPDGATMALQFTEARKLPGPGTHIGGMQASGWYLAMGIENNDGSPPVSDLVIKHTAFGSPESLGEYHFRNDTDAANGHWGMAGCVALATLPGRKTSSSRGMLMMVADYGAKKVSLYELPPDQYGFVNVHGGSWKWRGTWLTPELEWKAENCNLVAQADGRLYLITTSGPGPHRVGASWDLALAPPVRNSAWLWEVHLDELKEPAAKTHPEVSLPVLQRPAGVSNNEFCCFNGTCSTTGEVAFYGPAGIYTDPAVGLVMYGMHPFRPSLATDVVKMKQY